VDLSDVTAAGRLSAVHPGQILLREFLEPLAITPYRAAKDIGVPRNRVTGIVNGQRNVSADTALRFARYFGTSAAFWLNLQAQYDLRMAEENTGPEITRAVKPLERASA